MFLSNLTLKKYCILEVGSKAEDQKGGRDWLVVIDEEDEGYCPSVLG